MPPQDGGGGYQPVCPQRSGQLPDQRGQDRPLRLNGLIERLEHTNTYVPTAEGPRVAVFYTKLHNRLLRPLLAANAPPAPPELRPALATIDSHIRGYIDDARLGNAA